MTDEKTPDEKAPADPAPPHWKVVEDAIGEYLDKRTEARRAIRRKGGYRSRLETADGLPLLFVSESHIRHTLALFLRPKNDMPPVGVIYWFGFDSAERACVSTLIIPKFEDHDGILASAIADEEVFDLILKGPLSFLAEVRLRGASRLKAHGVPGIRIDGAFSIGVMPDFRFDLEKCRIKRQIGGKYKDLQPEDFHRHLRVVPGFRDLREYELPPYYRVDTHPERS